MRIINLSTFFLNSSIIEVMVENIEDFSLAVNYVGLITCFSEKTFEKKSIFANGLEFQNPASPPNIYTN